MERIISTQLMKRITGRLTISQDADGYSVDVSPDALIGVSRELVEDGSFDFITMENECIVICDVNYEIVAYSGDSYLVRAI